jgi:hypothetical protein
MAQGKSGGINSTLAACVVSDTKLIELFAPGLADFAKIFRSKSTLLVSNRSFTFLGR